MDVRPVHSLKESLPIVFTELGMVVDLHPIIRVLSLFRMMALQLSRESKKVLFGSTVIDVREEQREKASVPIQDMDLGIETEVRLEQPEKTLYLILHTDSGIVTEVRPEQS